MSAARRICLGLLARMPHGELTIVERGRTVTVGGGEPRATVRINTARAWSALLHGSRGLAEAYADAWWDAEDPAAVIRVAARNAAVLDAWRRRAAPVRVPAQALRGIRRANSRAHSRRDIAAHYDLGDDLFGLMLDETMMYSAAYFPSPGASLADASRAKLELVCEKLSLRPRDHVLEIGTGWGGFAIHAAATRGCRITTTTISPAQYEHARRRVARAGLEKLVTVVPQDYRDLDGRYDKLVSIEMVEAVGWRSFGAFFAQCSQLLRPDGVMLLQAIVIDDRAYEVEKASTSFIRTHIFPGGSLPSVEVIARCLARHTDLRIADLHELTPHYAEMPPQPATSYTGSATARASAGCGGFTSRTAKPGSTRGGSASCRCCWASHDGGRRSLPRRCATSASAHAAPPTPSSRRNLLAPSASPSADHERSRDQEDLTIHEIARRLGRTDATVEAYVYDPTGEREGAGRKGALHGGVRGLWCPHAAAQRQGRRVCLLQMRREALCCIPGAAGRNSKGCSWVQWLTRIRKVNGTIACQESDGHAQVSGVRRRGTRVIWRRLDCLKPNLQKMKRRIRRKGTCYRRHALRWHSCKAVATFGAWSVAQRGQ